MGLLGGIVRTAAVAGTAQATRNVVNRHAAKKNVEAYTEAEQAAYMGNRPATRCRFPARAPCRAQVPGNSHRRGVPSPEGKDTRHLTA